MPSRSWSPSWHLELQSSSGVACNRQLEGGVKTHHTHWIGRRQKKFWDAWLTWREVVKSGRIWNWVQAQMLLTPLLQSQLAMSFSRWKLSWLRIHSQVESSWLLPLWLNSEPRWRALNPNLLHLLWFLVKYTCAWFHALHQHLVPDPVGLLSHVEITQMVNMVQVVPPSTNKRSADKELLVTIAPFNVLAIYCPIGVGQVLPHPPLVWRSWE